MAVKQADPTTLAEITQNNQLKRESLHKLLAILGLSAVGGAGLRAAVGSDYLFGRPQRTSNTALGPAVLPLPRPVLADDEDEQRPHLPKLAADPPGVAPPQDNGVLASWFDRHVGEPAKRLRGDMANSFKEMPWVPPGVLLGAPLAGYGGYKLVDWLLNSKRHAESEQELEEARHGYQKALIGQYNPGQLAHASKAAADGTDVLERLAGAYEKRADSNWYDWLMNMGLGGYLATAGVIGAGTGYAAYKYTKDRGQTNLLQKAIKQRERERWGVRPPELEAVPVPVHVNRMGQPVANRLPKALDEDEEG